MAALTLSRTDLEMTGEMTGHTGDLCVLTSPHLKQIFHEAVLDREVRDDAERPLGEVVVRACRVEPSLVLRPNKVFAAARKAASAMKPVGKDLLVTM